jgi:thiamine biosynthesis lipoprotein
MAMGSELRIAIWTAEAAAARAAIDAAFAEFDRLENVLSVWRAQSDVQRLNTAAGRDAVAIGPDLLAVLDAAEDASRATNGAFDITFGALSDIWRFDHDQDDRVPKPEEIAARLPLIDHAAVITDRATSTARITRPGVKVHLGGIGKGYAVDRAAALLGAAGFADFALQAGGDLYASGRRGERPWRVGLNDPRGAGGESFATIELRNETFSTSGDYERFFLKDGVRYHHILDPRTGQPARLCRSVTIVAASALQADWLSTGVFIMGPEEGMALVERLPGVEAVIVTAANEVRVSSGLRDRLTLERQPTP